jgi:hypothetical protein
VILLEDGQIHKDAFSLLIWFMCAVSKGHLLTQSDEILILESVYTCLDSSYRYDISYESDSPSFDSPLSREILIRVMYGGKKGDMQFLTRLAGRTDNLVVLNDWKPLCPIVPFDETSLIMYAIDFHCYPELLSFIKRKSNWSINQIQTAIWVHWSSVNTRQLIEEEKQIDPDPEIYELFIQSVFHLTIFAKQKIDSFFQTRKKVLIQKKITDY